MFLDPSEIKKTQRDLKIWDKLLPPCSRRKKSPHLTVMRFRTPEDLIFLDPPHKKVRIEVSMERQNL